MSLIEGSDTQKRVPLSRAWLRDEAEERAKSWLGRFTREIRNFAHLPEDWNAYGARRPNAVAIGRAIEILDCIWQSRAVRPTHIAPSVEEGIMIAFVGQGLQANIECFNSGEIVAAIVRGNAEPIVWELDHDDHEIRTALAQITDALETRPAMAHVRRFEASRPRLFPD